MASPLSSLAGIQDAFCYQGCNCQLYYHIKTVKAMYRISDVIKVWQIQFHNIRYPT